MTTLRKNFIPWWGYAIILVCGAIWLIYTAVTHRNDTTVSLELGAHLAISIVAMIIGGMGMEEE